MQSFACGATRELYPPLEGTLPVQLEAEEGDARARARPRTSSAARAKLRRRAKRLPQFAVGLAEWLGIH